MLPELSTSYPLIYQICQDDVSSVKNDFDNVDGEQIGGYKKFIDLTDAYANTAHLADVIETLSHLGNHQNGDKSQFAPGAGCLEATPL